MANQPTRRSSFGMLLRRSKSSDFKGKKAQALKEAELEKQRAASRVPPKLPEFSNHLEQLSKSFGADLRPDSPARDVTRTDSLSRSPLRAPHAITSNVPVPPIPTNGFNPYARTESMTHRGRYSYASSAVSTINSPRRVRRRKDPTPFNILILGARGSGKTSFLEFLKTALALPAQKRSKRTEEDEFSVRAPPSGNFIPHYVETEIDGERIGLTLWDSEGLERNLVDLQLREMSSFLESKFEETFAEEMKVVRSPGVQDTHIHAAFLILDPAHLDRNIATGRKMSNLHQNGGYHMNGVGSGVLDDSIDMPLLRLLQGKTTVIPVISKADTVTTKHMNVLKKTVWDSLKKANMDPLGALGLDDEDGNSISSSRIDEKEEEDLREVNGLDDSDDSEKDMRPSTSASPNSKRLSVQSLRRHRIDEDGVVEETPFLPLSIISPDLYEPEMVGRQFPWGFADPYNEDHCDFTRLREAVFSEWRGDLRVASREQWYEGWRTNRLNHKNGTYRRH